MRPQNVNGLIPLTVEVNTDLERSESLLFSQELQKITHLKKTIKM